MLVIVAVLILILWAAGFAWIGVGAVVHWLLLLALVLLVVELVHNR